MAESCHPVIIIRSYDLTDSPKKHIPIIHSRRELWDRAKRFRAFYIMMIPGIAFFILFRYGAMWGQIMAFQNYSPLLGIFRSEWVGFSLFQRVIKSPQFFQLFRNTFIIAVYNIVFYFPIPIILALMLNEVKHQRFKRIVQSLVYVPHFISWMVVVGITYIMFNIQNGVVVQLWTDVFGTKLDILTNPNALRPTLVIQHIWKEAGWGTIIFLAALSGVDSELYEAAYIDGASGFQRLWHITLPSIRGTIMIMLILRMGRFLDTGFDQIFNMLNAMNRSLGEVFDTYIYTMGITGGQFSYTTAVGFFKSIIGLIMVYLCDKLAKIVGEEGVY